MTSDWWTRRKFWAGSSSSFSARAQQPPSKVLWPLFLVSFAALYIEVMLIRWLGTEVRVFAYFQNLVLITCFLGFGLGCYRPDKQRKLLFDIFAMAALIALVQLPIARWQNSLGQLSTLLSFSPDAVLWGGELKLTPGLAGLFLIAVSVMAVFLLLLISIMTPLGQWVGFYLNNAANPITAYSVNLIGSACGIWAFAGLAFLWLPPEYWFSLASFLLLLFLPVRPPGSRVIVALLAALLGCFVLLHHPRIPAGETHWSPYQKLDLESAGEHEYQIRVNNVDYMTIANAGPDFLSGHPGLAERYRDEGSYDAPFRFAQGRTRVLIVGAGAGNDAAAALRNRAEQVDTVEIDPVIYSFGERLHPEHPYSSAKVHKELDDARAFLRRAQAKYDVIVFGLLDSHTQFSDHSNVRLDSYVYTEEAFRETRRLLKPDGVLIVKFAVAHQWKWMGLRFYTMLDRIFGRPPIVFSVPQVRAMLQATVFITSNDVGLWTRAAQPELAGLIARNPPLFSLDSKGAPPATTDDWPYVYHRSHSIPRAYLTVSLILLALALLQVQGKLEPKRLSTWHFFFLGAGFLLLETQLISRLALYFGTTWVVNCVALTAILLMLVVANLYVARLRPLRLSPYYALLVACLIANYFFPWHRLPYGTRTLGTLLSLAYSLPIFCAGVVFTEMFRRCERKSSAFGANIVGAVAGGLAQNISFVVGMKALLLAATLFYALAALCGLPRTRERASGVASL